MDAPRRYDLPVTGMSCAACAVRLEKVLNRLPGVSAQVNFATGKARLSAGPEAADGDAVLVTSPLDRVFSYLDDQANADVFVEVARYQRSVE